MEPGGAAIFVSQSGETADTLASLRYCCAQGQHVLSVVNVRESSIARESDAVLPTLGGLEIGVAFTKAFTLSAHRARLPAIAAGKARGTIGPEREAELVKALVEVPCPVTWRRSWVTKGDMRSWRRCPRRATSSISAAGRALRRIALEGALKLKEISHIHAEGYAVAIEAWPHCPDRRERARHRHRPAGRALRQDGLQYAGSGRARGQDRLRQRCGSGECELRHPDRATGPERTSSSGRRFVYAVPVQLIAYHTAVGPRGLTSISLGIWQSLSRSSSPSKREPVAGAGRAKSRLTESGRVGRWAACSQRFCVCRCRPPWRRYSSGTMPTASLADSPPHGPGEVAGRTLPYWKIARRVYDDLGLCHCQGAVLARDEWLSVPLTKTTSTWALSFDQFRMHSRHVSSMT